MGAKNRVFVFTSGEYSDFRIKYVTSCRKQAKEYLKKIGLTLKELYTRKHGKKNYDYHDIELWVNGELFCRDKKTKWRRRCVRMDKRGSFAFVDTDEPCHSPKMHYMKLAGRYIKNPEWTAEHSRIVTLGDVLSYTPILGTVPERIYVYEPELFINGNFRSDEVAKRYADEVRCFLIENGTWHKAAAELGDDTTKIVRLDVKAL